MANLLSDFTLKGKTIKNRLVFPPCVCFNYSENGFVNERNIEHYTTMANGMSGLVVVEATCVSENGRLHISQLGIWDDKFIDGLKKVADAIRENGAVSLIQIHHAGLKTDINSAKDSDIFTASDYELPDGRVIREAKSEEIEEVIEQFKNAAIRAQKAGFDGVEIHGAHNYLVSQFLSGDVNKRTDEYGKDRALFGKRIIKAIKESVKEDFIVTMRLGANDDTMADGIKYAKEFEQAGLDMLNISSGHNTECPVDLAVIAVINDKYSWRAQLGMNIKKHVNVPVICVFGINTPEMADEIVTNGLCDFAAAAKGLLADPNWIVKYSVKRSIIPCLKCGKCAFYTDGKNCPARKMSMAE
ncbi:MAG: NADH:flavin oxidoreductase [Clostridiales bacterium]|jgi:2,4-dienoyl-CoA reductase-like NADH-dependent reductase (Old Yellow Enzyme family)|nr:NADH:flavin oxidoreductase [Clostridiales bacterium]